MCPILLNGRPAEYAVTLPCTVKYTSTQLYAEERRVKRIRAPHMYCCSFYTTYSILLWTSMPQFYAYSKEQGLNWHFIVCLLYWTWSPVSQWYFSYHCCTLIILLITYSIVLKTLWLSLTTLRKCWILEPTITHGLLSISGRCNIVNHRHGHNMLITWTLIPFDYML